MKSLKQFNKLKKQWESFKKNPDNKRIRIRDAAKKLCVSEAELLSTLIDDSVTYIKFNNFYTFIEKVLSLDKVMLLTRSDNVVHEITVFTLDLAVDQDGLIYDKNTFNPLLRIAPTDIAYTFSELKTHQGKNLYSFQFFNSDGNSIAKIYLKGKTESLFNEIVSEYKVNYDYSIQNKQSDTNKKLYDLNSSTIKYQFMPKNAPKFKKIKKIDGSALRTIMENLSKKTIPIQFHGIGLNTVQYYYGEIKNVTDYGPWINVMDKKFNIHILEKKIVSCQLNQLSINNKNYCSLAWFDINNQNVMGISPLIGSIEKFNKLLEKTGFL